MNPPYIHIAYPYHNIIPLEDNQHLSEAQLQSHPFRSRKDHPLFYDGLHRGRCSHGLLHGRTLGITLSRCHGGHLEPHPKVDWTKKGKDGWSSFVFTAWFNMVQTISISTIFWQYLILNHMIDIEIHPFWRLPRPENQRTCFKQSVDWSCHVGVAIVDWVYRFTLTPGAPVVLRGMGWGIQSFGNLLQRENPGFHFWP